jgi:hypothetical protein
MCFITGICTIGYLNNLIQVCTYISHTKIYDAFIYMLKNILQVGLSEQNYGVHWAMW